MASRLPTFPSQVTEGEITSVAVRDTDGRLDQLVFALIGLGCVALLATLVFWWLTRPSRATALTTKGQ